MEIVIKIPEESYNQIKRCADSPLLNGWYRVVKNGIPLPKGHGRLIDVERLYDDFESMDYDFEDAIEYAPTVIEADRAESEE